MPAKRNKYLLLNYVFIFCLLTLVVNDHYLKYEYGNWFTGKLSDMAGIILLPLLLTYLFPRLGRASVVLSALLFVFWKSPASQQLIDWYNVFALIKTGRVVDYTDLLVLSLLPLPWWLINKMGQRPILQIQRVHPLLVLLPTATALMATSPGASHYYTMTTGNLTCRNCHINVALPQDEILSRLQLANIVPDSTIVFDKYMRDSLAFFDSRDCVKHAIYRFVRIGTLTASNQTLHQVDLVMVQASNQKETRIYFNGLSTNDAPTARRERRKKSRYYRDIVFKELNAKLAP